MPTDYHTTISLEFQARFDDRDDDNAISICTIQEAQKLLKELNKLAPQPKLQQLEQTA